MYYSIVPLDDDFGDWATPKESTAGHFFSPHSILSSLPWLTFLRWTRHPLIPVQYRCSPCGSTRRLMPQLPEPNAMTLATASRAGRRCPRGIVLFKRASVKSISEFFTNYREPQRGRIGRQPPCRPGAFMGGVSTANPHRGACREGERVKSPTTIFTSDRLAIAWAFWFPPQSRAHFRSSFSRSS